MEGDPALVHLLKLAPATPQGTLAEVLQTLWKNRRTGLNSLEKSRVRSLLALSVTDELDPVSVRTCSVLNLGVVPFFFVLSFVFRGVEDPLDIQKRLVTLTTIRIMVIGLFRSVV